VAIDQSSAVSSAWLLPADSCEAAMKLRGLLAKQLSPTQVCSLINSLKSFHIRDRPF
jgi:hypothetical protein